LIMLRVIINGGLGRDIEVWVIRRVWV
jgi:hypothetical protein